MTKYTWKIEQLDCIPSNEGQTNVVVNVRFCVTADNGVNKTIFYEAQPLTFNAKNAFVDYADLTKNQVIGWVQEAMGADAVTALQNELDKHLELIANPPIVKLPLPWAE